MRGASTDLQALSRFCGKAVEWLRLTVCSSQVSFSILHLHSHCSFILAEPTGGPAPTLAASPEVQR